MEFHLSYLLLLLACLPAILALQPAPFEILVDGSKIIAETDDNFICYTLDMWPDDVCIPEFCLWTHHASLFYLDLNNPLLINAVKAFTNLRIRVGGSLQDQLLYKVGSLTEECHPFRKLSGGLFGYSEGCLEMSRWDALNDFFNKTGATVTFGLNALIGRHKMTGTTWGGDWNYTNAQDFINYTISKGYNIDSWEFGNELSGSGIGARVGVQQYGKDLITLRKVVEQLYAKSEKKPLVVAPGGFFDNDWYENLVRIAGPDVIDALTIHIYNLGAGKDPKVIDRIVNPWYLNGINDTFKKLEEITQRHPWVSPWVGEAGGAWKGGSRHVQDAFVGGFWYLDQLGISARYNTKVYCRQDLIGGHYGVLNSTSLTPTPDYYGGLLWSKLMGKRVLEVDNQAWPYLRAYAHCSRNGEGITLLYMSLSTKREFILQTGLKNETKKHAASFVEDFEDHEKKMIKSSNTDANCSNPFVRKEYHLTPKDGDLRSVTVLLNGSPLELTENGDIPELNPVLNDIRMPLYVAPYTMSFIVYPHLNPPACKYD